MRHFIRHPTEVPIEISASEASVPRRRLVNVSLGGLSFRSERPYPVRSTLKLRVPCVQPPFETEVQVVWCQTVAEGYDIGAAFLAPQDAFTARMVEQICRIDEYRAHVRAREGRALTVDEAAAEWISKFATEFERQSEGG